jgi:hypothetical protein
MFGNKGTKEGFQEASGIGEETVLNSTGFFKLHKKKVAPSIPDRRCRSGVARCSEEEKRGPDFSGPLWVMADTEQGPNNT